MKLALLLVLPALAVAVPKPDTCRLVDAIPFFNDASGRDGLNDEDLNVLTEFARFMNHKVPQMLEEFAHMKNIMNVGRSNLRMPKNMKLNNEIGALFDVAEEIARAQVQSKFFLNKIILRPDETEEEEEETTEPNVEEDSQFNKIKESIKNAVKTVVDKIKGNPTEEPKETEKETEPTVEENKIKASIKKVVKKVVDSMKEVVETIKSKPLSVSSIKSIFSGIIDGVKKTLTDSGIPLPTEEKEEVKPTTEEKEEVKPTTEEKEEVNKPAENPIQPASFFSKWPLVCKAIWYPYDKEKCRSARCMACAPAMMASAQVCRKSEGTVSQRCLEVTLGDGFCNFCIGDYAEL